MGDLRKKSRGILDGRDARGFFEHCGYRQSVQFLQYPCTMAATTYYEILGDACCAAFAYPREVLKVALAARRTSTISYRFRDFLGSEVMAKTYLAHDEEFDRE